MLRCLIGSTGSATRDQQIGPPKATVADCETARKAFFDMGFERRNA